MANKHNQSSEKPSLEEVLRFKQAEQPTEAFWNQFDRELHQRMLRTLVKKDPWPIQLMRGLTGRMAQTSAVAAVVAFLAVSMIRPAFVGVDQGHSANFAESQVDHSQPLSGLESIGVSDTALPVFASADYRIDTVLAADVISTVGVTREFEMDSIQMSAYDAAVYTTDSAITASSAFASAGVALVF